MAATCRRACSALLHRHAAVQSQVRAHAQLRCLSSVVPHGKAAAKPAGLADAQDITSLDEWRAKKAEVKVYRKRRFNQTEAKVKAGRPERPRVAMTAREAWFKERAASLHLHQKECEKLDLDWEYKAAVLFERLPIVVPEMEDWEEAYEEFRNQTMWRTGRVWPEELDTWKEDMESSPTMREQLEDPPIPVSPRITEADKANDRTSMNRQLDKRLFLIVKEGSEARPWQFLHTAVQRDQQETLRAAAERVMSSALAPNRNKSLQYWHVGNAPAGVRWEVHSAEQREKRKAYGTKLLFMRAQLLSPEPPVLLQRYSEKLWVTKTELREYFGDEQGDYFEKML
jgi:large subunit ribosomal protein L46